MRTYYLKPPNISWGLIFPLAWTGMFFIRSGEGLDSIPALLPGVMAVSVLFGTTSLLSVTVTFEKKGRSFERLLLAPISLERLMLAKTAGAILFGVVNAFVPVLIGMFLADLSGLEWGMLIPAVFLIAVSSTFLGLFIAVSVSEVFEAQTFSNFFRFPMLFLCGLFLPVAQLPVWLRPLSYVLPLTYGADLLHAAVGDAAHMPAALNFILLAAGQDVRIFLMNDSVDMARDACKPPENYDQDLVQMLKDLVAKGVPVKVCGTCMARCGIHKNQPYFDGAQKATMPELAEWVIESDKVITF